MKVKSVEKIMVKISKELGSVFTLEHIENNRFLIHNVNNNFYMDIVLDNDISYYNIGDGLGTDRDDLNIYEIIKSQCLLLLNEKDYHVS